MGGWKQPAISFLPIFKEEVLAIIEKPHRNWKAELQDYCQKNFQKPPEYTVLRAEGPDHLKTFYIQVELDGNVFGKGKGSSKKEGEQAAAENAILNMERKKGG
jgi:ribonuclease-3